MQPWHICGHRGGRGAKYRVPPRVQRHLDKCAESGLRLLVRTLGLRLEQAFDMGGRYSFKSLFYLACLFHQTLSKSCNGTAPKHHPGDYIRFSPYSLAGLLPVLGTECDPNPFDYYLLSFSFIINSSWH